jgi:16S rRNA (adenine(1408)-N(1))-methyltransferase
MRILQGTKVVEAPADWRERLDGRRVVIDVGAGDGRWAYDSARRDAESVYIALDPDAESLAEYAYRAGRKPSRGGVENALFVVAAVEDLPPELRGIASVVRVNFPWGSLLRGLVLPEAPVLEALAGLGAQSARFELVISYDPEHDIAGLAGETLPPLSVERIDSVLAAPYATAGLQITDRREMSLDEAISLPSTWARRLLHGRKRDVFWIEGVIAVAQ